MLLREIRSAGELEALVEELGFLPFFSNKISGFSVEDCCPKDFWFVDGVDGPWEWKYQIAAEKKIAYGKFFAGKAGYIAHRFIPHFVNYRRDGYDFDALYDDGKATHKSKEIFELIEKNGSMLSCDIKEELDYKKGGQKGFDTVITALQMQCYLSAVNFEYRRDKSGKSYGWGIARYDRFENTFGADFTTSEYSADPMQSKKHILDRLTEIIPEIADKQLKII